MTVRDPRRLSLTDAALTGLTVVPHPCWDMLNSILVLARSRSLPEFPYRTWARSALAALADTPAAELVRWCRTWPAMRVPAFLIPVGPNEGGFRTADPDDVRHRLKAEFPDGTPPAFASFAKDPTAAMADLSAQLDVYFRLALQRWWPAVTAAVNEDIAFRGQVITGGGIGSALAELHPGIRWSPPVLASSTAEFSEAPGRCSRVVLVPLMFARDEVLFHAGPAGTVQIGYQSRGTAALLHGGVLDGQPENTRLARLLGRTRAAVLQELDVPSTTTALAGRLSLAPSTVSEHLSALVTMHVAVRHRKANRVYYGLTSTGRQLLDVFSQENAA